LHLYHQSGPYSNAFIDIYTINVQTGSSGASAGTAVQMTTLGNRITGSGIGNLGDKGANNTISDWQQHFGTQSASH